MASPHRRMGCTRIGASNPLARNLPFAGWAIVRWRMFGIGDSLSQSGQRLATRQSLGDIMAKSIIITGAGRGVGRACAELFLEHGWTVGLVGRTETALRETAGNHKNAVVLTCDVTDEQQVDDAFDWFAAKVDTLDVLFNNAGVSLPGKPIDEINVS